MRTFTRFIKLCAGRAGQLLNYSELAKDAGISHTTTIHWLSLLEASYIIFMLPHTTETSTNDWSKAQNFISTILAFCAFYWELPPIIWSPPTHCGDLCLKIWSFQKKWNRMHTIVFIRNFIFGGFPWKWSGFANGRRW